MKTTTMWVIAIALVAATGCSETETEVIDSGGDDQVALGISPNLKVEAGTSYSDAIKLLRKYNYTVYER